MTEQVQKIADHLADEHDKFQRDLVEHKDKVAIVINPDPITTVVGDVTHGVGTVFGGVAVTAADAAGVVGSSADAVHNAIDVFFHNLRGRLGL